MAKDDYEVIVYKILAYLYECMKNGKTPDLSDYCCNCTMFRIPQSYWDSVMEELIENGYIKYASLIPSIGSTTPGIRVTPDTCITIRGVEYLKDNSTMARVREILGGSFQTVLSGMISALV